MVNFYPLGRIIVFKKTPQGQECKPLIVAVLHFDCFGQVRDAARVLVRRVFPRRGLDRVERSTRCAGVDVLGRDALLVLFIGQALGVH